MAEINGEREIGAALMVDAEERRIGDGVEALLAAMIGMGAPADIAQQAGRVAQPLLDPQHARDLIAWSDRFFSTLAGERLMGRLKTLGRLLGREPLFRVLPG